MEPLASAFAAGLVVIATFTACAAPQSAGLPADDVAGVRSTVLLDPATAVARAGTTATGGPAIVRQYAPPPRPPLPIPATRAARDGSGQ